MKPCKSALVIHDHYLIVFVRWGWNVCNIRFNGPDKPGIGLYGNVWDRRLKVDRGGRIIHLNRPGNR